MGNAFQEGHTLIFDHIHRRDSKSEGLEVYPEEVIRCHEDFTQQICESMVAKVEVVYGDKIQKRILNNRKSEYTILPLWDWLEGVFLALAHESNYSNADPNHQFRRVLLFATHPQRLFFEPPGSQTPRRQDNVISAAAQMVGGHIPVVKDYFQKKIWRTQMPTIAQKAEIKALGTSLKGLLNPEDLQNLGQGIRSVGETTEGGTWHKYFNLKPHSTKYLRETLPEALKICEELEPICEWIDPSDFPESVLNWFRGQKQILFQNTSISGLADILPVFHQLCSSSTSYQNETDGQSLRGIICEIMKRQREFLGNLRQSQLDEDLWHSGFGLYLIETCCKGCKSTTRTIIDNATRWAVERPGQYITRRHVCQSDTCNGACPYWIPIDSTIPYVRPGKGPLLREPRPKFDAWRGCLQTAVKDNTGFSKPVNSWCIQCREKTRISKDRKFYQDTTPLWTLGISRPLYVERTPQCLRCMIDLQRASGRFVPVEDIPSITRHNLLQFAECFGKYNETIMSKLLDHWPASSRTPQQEDKDKNSSEDEDNSVC